MPISPKDIKPEANKRDRQFESRVAALEAQIDKCLIKIAPRAEELVQYSLPMNEPADVIERLIADYRAKGWKVERFQGVPQDACNDLRFTYI